MEFFPRLIALRAGRILFDKPSSAVTPADLDALFRLQPEASDGASEGAERLEVGTGLGGRFG